MGGGGQNRKDRTTVSLAAGEPMKKDAIVTSILFLMLALGAFIESMKLPFGRISAPAAGFFPAVLAVLLALASLFFFVEALRGSHEGAVQGEPLTWKKIVLTLGSLLVFGVVFERLGYLLATFLFHHFFTARRGASELGVGDFGSALGIARFLRCFRVAARHSSTRGFLAALRSRGYPGELGAGFFCRP